MGLIYRGFADNQYGRGYGNALSAHTEIGNLVLGDLVRGIASDHFDIRIPILDNGGAPVSGRVCAYTDPAHTELFKCQEISPTMGTAATLYFTDAVPGTSYFVETMVNNTKDTLTVQTLISCPTDLSLRVYHNSPFETRGCDPPEGKDYHFYISISGNDPSANLMISSLMKSFLTLRVSLLEPPLGEMEQRMILACGCFA